MLLRREVVKVEVVVEVAVEVVVEEEMEVAEVEGGGWRSEEVEGGG